MSTVLTDIEAMVNSRPLTYVGDDVRDLTPLTPSLLAIGRERGSVPDEVPRKAKVTLSDRYRYQQRLGRHFWNRWLHEYLSNLTVRQKWPNRKQPLKVNDVVLVADDNIPRNSWILGKVEKVFPGRDGLVRTVKVRTSRSLLSRPVQKIC